MDTKTFKAAVYNLLTGKVYVGRKDETAIELYYKHKLDVNDPVLVSASLDVETGGVLIDAEDAQAIIMGERTEAIRRHYQEKRW